MYKLTMNFYMKVMHSLVNTALKVQFAKSELLLWK